jgi:hypothetical protein
MNENRDYQDFCEAWLNAHAMSSSNQIPSENTLMAVFDVLSEYPLDHVLSALKVHSKRSRFAPTPADVVEIIDERTGAKHLTADEAWVIALQSFDEFATVVWTKEMAEARAIAGPVYESGDVIAARMAFKDAYNRIIKTANDPVWFVNVGFDAARRADAVKEAILLKRLPADYVDPYPRRLDATVQPGTNVAGLIEHAQKKTGKVSPLAALGVIRSILNESTDLTEAEFQERRKKRLEFDAHKQDAVAKVERKMAELH